MLPDLSLNDGRENFEMRKVLSCFFDVVAWVRLNEPVLLNEELPKGNFEDNLPKASVNVFVIPKYKSEQFVDQWTLFRN